MSLLFIRYTALASKNDSHFSASSILLGDAAINGA